MRSTQPLDLMVDNQRVPFTLAHAAAALPFRDFRLVPSALLIGTLAPDFEYFIRFSLSSGFGHTLLGAFVLTLPLAVLVLWIFHSFVKLPAAKLLPHPLQRRLVDHCGEFRFRGAGRFCLIIVSVLLGIATHLVWDSFTHPNTWLYHHWSFLRQPVRVPLLGMIPRCRLLQHASTMLGIGILSVWFAGWYRRSEPSAQVLAGSVTSRQKIAITTLLVSVSFAGGILRALWPGGIPLGSVAQRRFLGEWVVTAIPVLWWQLVAYGVFTSTHFSPNKSDRHRLRFTQ